MKDGAVVLRFKSRPKKGVVVVDDAGNLTTIQFPRDSGKFLNGTRGFGTPSGTGINQLIGAVTAGLTNGITFDGNSFGLSEWGQSLEGTKTLANLAGSNTAGGVLQAAKDGATGTIYQQAIGMVGTGLINAGVYLLQRDVLDSIPPDSSVSLEEETLPGLVARRELFAWQVDARFIDIGTPASYATAQSFFDGPTR